MACKWVSTILKPIVCLLPLPMCYGAIFFLDSFWYVLLVCLVSLLPYVLVNKFITKPTTNHSD